METIERTIERRVIGEQSAIKLAAELVENSIPFEFEPEPYARYWFAVIGDERTALLDAAMGRLGCQLATPYLDALAENTDSLCHINPGPASSCHVCRSNYDLAESDSGWEELSDEGGFGKTPCDLCDSSLAGNRFDFHGFASVLFDKGDREPIHLSGCVDCLHYFANGTEPQGWEA